MHLEFYGSSEQWAHNSWWICARNSERDLLNDVTIVFRWFLAIKIESIRLKLRSTKGFFLSGIWETTSECCETNLLKLVVVIVLVVHQKCWWSIIHQNKYGSHFTRANLFSISATVHLSASRNIYTFGARTLDLSSKCEDKTKQTAKIQTVHYIKKLNACKTTKIELAPMLYHFVLSRKFSYVDLLRILRLGLISIILTSLTLRITSFSKYVFAFSVIYFFLIRLLYFLHSSGSIWLYTVLIANLLRKQTRRRITAQ